MPFEIILDKLPAGYVAHSVKPGEPLLVQVTEFLSSEDGENLITKLEGLPQDLLSKISLKIPVQPSQVDTFLAIIRKDKKVTIYLNEIRPILSTRIKTCCKKGDLIVKNQVLDVGRARFEDLEIPKDAGVMYVFSVGWRRGFFYDLSPVLEGLGQPRPFDFEELLGSLYSYLFFQERFKISEDSWEKLFQQKWFPFCHIDDDILRRLVRFAKDDLPIDGLLSRISGNVIRLLKEQPPCWRSNPIFADHDKILDTAVERYLAGDYVSCSSILYTRIEGILRSIYRAYISSHIPRDTEEIDKAIIERYKGERLSPSLLMPEKFRKYLDDVYFASFKPGSAPDVSRHSVAHGEARPDDFSLKASTIGFLIVFQITLFLPSGKE